MACDGGCLQINGWSDIARGCEERKTGRKERLNEQRESATISINPIIRNVERLKWLHQSRPRVALCHLSDTFSFPICHLSARPVHYQKLLMLPDRSPIPHPIH